MRPDRRDARVDIGSTHRGKRSVDRLQGAWPNLIVVHTPIHASWLNQAEIYFSVVQRKALQPNDFADVNALQHHLLAFGRHYERIATPFEWKFTPTISAAYSTSSTPPPAARLAA